MNSNKIIGAQQDLESGYNCSQSIVKQYAQELGLSESLALKLASGFGGGMRRGHTCGVITGAIMVLGLKFGNDVLDQEHKERLYHLVRSFTDEFMVIHQSTCCKELLGYDTGTEEGRAKAREEGLYRSVCPELVRTAIELLEARLKEDL